MSRIKPVARPRTYWSVMTTLNKLSHAHSAWFSFSRVTRSQTVCFAFAPAEHEKQLEQPPDRCRHE